MILADTSVWVDHFRRGAPHLAELLERQMVLTHPFVIGELACGNLRNRREILDLLAALPRATAATDEEALLFLDERSLMGRGIGWIDTHLLAASTLTPDARLWTRDRRLREVTRELALAYDEE